MRRALRPGRREGRRGQSHSEGCPGGIWAPEVFLVPHIQARSIEKPKQSFSPMGRFLPRGAELLCPSPAADLHSASAPSPGRVGCFGPRPWSCLKCNCCLQLVQKWISCGCGGRNVSVGAELLCPSPAADLHSASAPSPGRVGCFGTRPWSCLKCNCCLQLVQKWISCGCGGRNVSVARAGLKPCHGEAQAPQQCLHFSSCPSELSTASAQSSGACLLGSAGGQASLLCVHGPHGSTLQSELTVCTGGGVLEWDQLRALQGLHFAFHSTGQASQMCSSSRMGTRAPAAAVNPSARTLVPLQPGPAAWQGDLLWLGSCGLQLSPASMA
ncbi:uncharacterized protein LOC135174547 isoform X3 [Pogoniulus pusillus]|uniref:uncharacterized protein LOC135174547 isoform X3 n=1 Tax=Pogoniulus pusillus TaxID=488313 RepID=UPI0030B99744